MIVWALGGLFVGWIVSTRLRVDNLVVFLLSSIALPIIVFAVVQRVDVEVLWGYAVFWVAVQGTYLLGNLLAEKGVPAADRVGGGGSLESA